MGPKGSHCVMDDRFMWGPKGPHCIVYVECYISNLHGLLIEMYAILLNFKYNWIIRRDQPSCENMQCAEGTISILSDKSV